MFDWLINMFNRYMTVVDWIVRRIDGHCDGGPIWRTKNNPQTIPIVVAAGLCAGVAVQTSSAPVNTVATIVAVVLAAIIILVRVAGATATQRRTWLLAVVAAIKSAAHSAMVLLCDAIVPQVGDNPTPHAGAPPGRERAPRPHRTNLIRCAGRRSREAGDRVAGLHMLMPV